MKMEIEETCQTCQGRLGGIVSRGFGLLACLTRISR